MIAVEYCVERWHEHSGQGPPTSGDHNEVSLVAGATVNGSPSVKKMALRTEGRISKDEVVYGSEADKEITVGVSLTYSIGTDMLFFRGLWRAHFCIEII